MWDSRRFRRKHCIPSVIFEEGREAWKVGDSDTARVRAISPSSRTVSSISRGIVASMSRSAMLYGRPRETAMTLSRKYTVQNSLRLN